MTLMVSVIAWPMDTNGAVVYPRAYPHKIKARLDGGISRAQRPGKFASVRTWRNENVTNAALRAARLQRHSAEVVMNPDPRPRLAVVIPVFRAGFLGEALDSVFAQTCRADEVIVVDDGSPDRGPLGDAVGRWGRRLRVIAQVNTGAGAARNRGILASDADLIAFLDADDRWVPQ
ncbi:MAG: glycosyltransferase family 2 protein, partial [Vicinamibacterales bacterium]